MTKQKAPRCEALVEGTMWYMPQCDKRAKHTVTAYSANPNNPREEPPDTEEVHVCGIHKRVLDRGRSLSVFVEGTRYGRPVYGIRSDVEQLRGTVANAQYESDQHRKYEQWTNMSIGSIVSRHIDRFEALVAQIEDEDVRADLESAVRIRREYNEKKQRLFTALREAEAALDAASQ